MSLAAVGQAPRELQSCLDGYLKGTCTIRAVFEEVFKDPSNKAQMGEAAHAIVTQMSSAQKKTGFLGNVKNFLFGSSKASDAEVLKVFAEVLQKRIESNKADTKRPQKYSDEEFYDYLPLNLYTFLDPLCRGVSTVFDRAEYKSKKAQFIASAIKVNEEIKKFADQLYPKAVRGKPLYDGETLSALYTVPSDERDGVMRQAKTLMSTSDFHQPEYIVKIIADAASHQRDKLVTDITSLIKAGATDTAAFLTHIYQNIPQDQRADILAHTVLLLQNTSINTNTCLYTLLKAVVAISQADRVTVVNHANSLFRDKQQALKTAQVLTRLASFPHDERAELIEQVLPWFRGRYDTNRRISFLTRVAAIPRHERADVLAHARRILSNCDNLLELETWLQAIAKIPLAERADVLAYLESYNNISELETWLQAIAKIPRAERADVMAFARPYLGGRERQSEKIELLRLIARIPREKRGNLIAYTKQFLLPEHTLHRMMTILHAMAAIASDQIGDVIAHATPWLSKSDTERKIVQLLEQIARIPQEQRGEVIQERVQALSPFQYIEGWCALLAGIVTVSQNRLSEVITRTASLASGLREIDAIEALLCLVADLDSTGQMDVVDRTIPLIQENMHIVQRVSLLIRSYLGVEGDHAYIINIARRELQDSPLQLLHALCEQFKQKICERLSVLFLGEQGIDNGGLGREFVTELFTGIRDKMHFKERENGLFVPQHVRGPLSDLDKATLNELGQVLMFCLNASEDYPIGMLFDRSVFEALIRFDDRHLQQFERVQFDELFSIYSAMNYKEADRKSIASMKACLQPLTTKTPDNVLKDAYAAVEAEGQIAKLGIDYDVEKIRQHYPAIQHALKKFLSEEVIQPALLPIIEIAKGLRDAPFNTKVSWNDIRGMDADTLADRLQGVVTREMILDKLQFEEGISEDKKKWFQNWILKADGEKIKKFLFAMTGASSLGRKPLTIHKSSDKFVFHTCLNQLDIPIDTLNSERMFVTHLNATILGKENNIG